MRTHYLWTIHAGSELTVDIDGSLTTSTNELGSLVERLTLVASGVNFAIGVEDTEIGVTLEVAPTALPLGVDANTILEPGVVNVFVRLHRALQSQWLTLLNVLVPW